MAPSRCGGDIGGGLIGEAGSTWLSVQRQGGRHMAWQWACWQRGPEKGRDMPQPGKKCMRQWQDMRDRTEKCLFAGERCHHGSWRFVMKRDAKCAMRAVHSVAPFSVARRRAYGARLFARRRTRKRRFTIDVGLPLTRRARREVSCAARGER